MQNVYKIAANRRSNQHNDMCVGSRGVRVYAAVCMYIYICVSI